MSVLDSVLDLIIDSVLDSILDTISVLNFKINFRFSFRLDIRLNFRFSFRFSYRFDFSPKKRCCYIKVDIHRSFPSQAFKCEEFIPKMSLKVDIYPIMHFKCSQVKNLLLNRDETQYLLKSQF